MGAKEKRESMRIVPPGKKKCVWMEAGVVSYKLCDNNYDCPTCVYDQGMQLKVARQKEAAAANERRKSGQSDRYELEFIHSNGRRVSSLVSGSPRFDPDGNFSGTMAVFTNITERKRAEIALKESELRFRSV